MPPEPVTEFQTARLFLAHFGLLNIGGEKKVCEGHAGHRKLTALSLVFTKESDTNDVTVSPALANVV